MRLKEEKGAQSGVVVGFSYQKAQALARTPPGTRAGVPPVPAAPPQRALYA